MSAAASHAAETPAALRQSAQRIIAAHDLQGEMPGPRPGPPDWWLGIIDALNRAGAWLARQLDWLPFSSLAWLIVAGIALAVLCAAIFWLVETLSLRQARREAPASAAAAGDAPADDLMLETDELARQGRYAEAIHALLLYSLAMMRRRLSLAMADCLTSREIVAASALPAPALGALDDLVVRVEFSHFGRYPVVGRDYDFCRRRFAILMETVNGAAP